jgi:hypothetical protein
VLVSQRFAVAGPEPEFLICTSKTYSFVVVPQVSGFLEGAYFKGFLVSYAHTNGRPSDTLSNGKTIWKRNGGFVVTVDHLVIPPDVDPIAFDGRRSFKIEDADGEEEKFPTEVGLCVGALGLSSLR